MSKREYKLFIQDIVDEIDRTFRFVNKLDTIEDLEKDELVLYAVLKSLENIGENELEQLREVTQKVLDNER